MFTVARFVNDLDRVLQKATLEMGMKLAKGQCPNHEQYHRMVGRCEGMAEAVNTARQMLRQIELADQDDSGLPEMTGTDDPQPRKKRGRR